MDIENLRKVYPRSTSAAIQATLVLENVALSEPQIVHLISNALAIQSGVPLRGSA